MRALLVIACVLLGVAMFAMPSGFYTLLRWWLCIVGLLLCGRWAEGKLPAWVGAGGLLCGVLYNPFIPVYLSRDIWLWINIASLVFFIMVVLFLSGRPKLLFGVYWSLLLAAVVAAYVGVGFWHGFVLPEGPDVAEMKRLLVQKGMPKKIIFTIFDDLDIQSLSSSQRKELEKAHHFFVEAFDGKMGDGKAVMDGYFGEENYGNMTTEVKQELRAHQLVVHYFRWRGVSDDELEDGGIRAVRAMASVMDGITQGFEATGIYNFLCHDIKGRNRVAIALNQLSEDVYKQAARGYTYRESLMKAAAAAKLSEEEKSQILPKMRLVYSNGEFIGSQLKSKMGVMKSAVREYEQCMDAYLWGGMFFSQESVSVGALAYALLNEGELRGVAEDILREGNQYGCYGERVWKSFNRGAYGVVRGAAGVIGDIYPVSPRSIF